MDNASSAVDACRRQVGILCQALFITLLMILVSPAPADSAPEPEGQPHGRIYCDAEHRLLVAIGHTVLELPEASADFIAPLGLANVPWKLRPPNPSQPLGCYGNPLQIPSLPLAQALLTPKEFYWKTPDAMKVPALRTDLRVQRTDVTKATIGDDMARVARTRTCQAPNVVTYETFAYAICIIPRKGELSLLSAMSFEIKSSFLPSTFDGPILFSCGEAINADLEGLSPCRLALIINADLHVEVLYSRPREGDAQLLFDKTIDMIREIERNFDPIIIRDYAWP